MRGVLLFVCSLFPVAGWTEEPQPQQAEEQQVDPVWAAAIAASVQGPKDVTFRDQAVFALPSGYRFIPTKEAAVLMDRMGNQTGDTFLGLILPESDLQWFATVDFEEAGYIKDDDAREWDADELLDNLKEGTKAGNEHRKKVGVPSIEVTRWVQAPAYDATSHRLVWSAEIREIGTAEQDPGVNYNTYVLGREGYISLNLVTAASLIEDQKPMAHQLLAAVNFNDGKKYGDFNSSTDKVAAYGLAALIGGIAAKKLGLLALAGAFIVKFAKVILVGIAALGGGLAKWFKGRKASAAS